MSMKSQQRPAPVGSPLFAARLFVVLTVLSLLAPSLPAIDQTSRPPEHGSGVNYAHYDIEAMPWSIHVLKLDRTRAEFRFETTLGQSNQLGMAVVSEQVKMLPPALGRPIAAVNGDFYKSASKYPGDPEGLQIIRGELVSGPSSTRSCFWIDPAGQPHHSNVLSRFTATLPDGKAVPFGLNEERPNDDFVLYTGANGASTRTSGGVELILTHGAETNWLPLRIGQTITATVRQVRSGGDAPLMRDTLVLSAGSKVAPLLAGVKPGDKVKLSTATTPTLTGCNLALGGGPALVRNGQPVAFKGIQPRHPRVALGWNKDSYFLVEVDGRQKNSVGMSFPELVTYMIQLGCTEAINLDGGGSATMWVYGNVMNSPSEGHERPAANALIVVRKDLPK